MDMRTRMKSIEGPNMKFGIRPNTTMERISETMNTMKSTIDNASKDNIMLILPDWKPTDKKKWVSKNNFDLTVSRF